MQSRRLFRTERSDRRETGEREEAGLDVSLQLRAGRPGDRSEGAAGPGGQNIPGGVLRHSQRGQNISEYSRFKTLFLNLRWRSLSCGTV